MRSLVLVLWTTASLSAGDTLLVGHKHADSVGFYDAKTGGLLATVPVGVRPHEMEFSKDRKLAFVTNYGVNTWTQTEQGGNTLSVVDVKARKEIAKVELGKHHRPHGIEQGHRTGRLYITTDFPASVVVIDTAKRSVVQSFEVEGQKAPHMLAVTRDEKRAFVANSGSGSVSVISLDGSQKPVHVDVGGVPMGITLNQDESLCLVATRSSNQVVAIDTRSNAVAYRLDIKGQPARVRFTEGDAHLVVTLIETGETAIWDTKQRREIKRMKSGAASEGIQIDAPNGFLYIAAQGADKVVKYRMGTWEPVLEIKTASRPDPMLLF